MTAPSQGAGAESAPHGARRSLGPFPRDAPRLRSDAPDRARHVRAAAGPRARRQAAARGRRRRVDHIDTAEYYGPTYRERAIREALHPYPPELILVSKVGAGRDDGGGITSPGRRRSSRRP